MSVVVAQVTDRFEVLNTLGAAHPGAAVRVSDRWLAQSAVMKRWAGLTEEEAHDVERQLNALAAIAHPGLARIYDISPYSEDANVQVVREFVEGRSVAEFLKSALSVTLMRRMELAHELLEPLCCLHSYGYCHGNLKPTNAFVVPNRGVLLMDAISLPPRLRSSTRDVRYLSPEHVGHGVIGPASDVFCAASICYELLAGRPAFAGASEKEIAGAIGRGAHGPFASSEIAGTGIDSELAAAFAARTEDRCSAQQLLDAVARARETISNRARIPTAIVVRGGAAAAPAPEVVEEPVEEEQCQEQQAAADESADMARPTPEFRLAPESKYAPPARVSRDWPQGVGLLIGALAAVLIAAVYFAVTISALPIWNIRTTSSAATAATTKPDAKDTVLQVNATPWATIKSIGGLDGRNVTLDQSFTPIRVLVTPGAYRVIAVGPDGTTQKTNIVEVREGATSLIKFDFKKVDSEAIVNAYR